MRDWSEKADALEAAGARLLVLSADSPEVLRAQVARRGFDHLTVASASPDHWVALGVANPKRPELPHPTTLVVAPDGTEWFRETHENFRRRTAPEDALAALRARVEAEPAPSPRPAPIDWEAAATVTVTREGSAVRMVLEIAEGFHAYGARETTGVPVFLAVDEGPRAPVPEGQPKEWPGGTSWVLDGRVELSIEVGEGPVSGTAGWQLCTASSCSPPSTRPFSL